MPDIEFCLIFIDWEHSLYDQEIIESISPSNFAIYKQEGEG